MQTNSSEDKFRISVSVPFLDHFLSQIFERLLSHKNLLNGFLCLLPDGTCSKPTNEPTSKTSLISTLKISRLVTLLFLGNWIYGIRQVAAMEKPPNKALDALLNCNPDVFPSLRTLI